jgi:hypothetical protein
MAIVRVYGAPDLFVTYTCNPSWVEITRELGPGQSAADRPDIVCRVFDQRRKAFLKMILRGGIYGRVVAYLAVIEFQKRGLPHMHLILWLHRDDKLRTPEDIDAMIRAELPDKDQEPRLYETVVRTMLHRCSDRCKPSGAQFCRYGYPKAYMPETIADAGAFPMYRRRDDGKVVRGRRGAVYTNRNVVPYNPYTTQME